MNDDPYIQFGFDGEKPRPADPKAIDFADKLTEMMLARRKLGQAMEDVPDYTGQWERSDYYASEEEEYNRAADDLWNFVKENANA